MVTYSTGAVSSSHSGSWTYVRSGDWEAFLHQKCMLLVLFLNNRASQALSYLKVSCRPVPYVALTYFVLVNSIFFVLLEIKHVTEWDTFWFQTLCLEEGTRLTASSHEPHLVHFLPTSARVLWACYCHRSCWALFLWRRDTSVPNQRGKPTAMHLGFELLEKARDWIVPCGHLKQLGLWEQVLDITLCMCCQLQVQTSPKKQSVKLLNQRSGLSLVYNSERHTASLKQNNFVTSLELGIMQRKPI